MKYNCIGCNYSTDDMANYSRHVKTRKHTIIVELAEIEAKKLIFDSDHTCKKCMKIFKHSSSYSRHKNKCQNKMDTVADKNKDGGELINLCKELMQQNKDLAEFKYKYEARVEMFDKIETIRETHDKENKEDKAYLQKLVNDAGSITKTSVNALSYAVKNFSKAPALLPITYCESIELNNDAIKLCDELVFYYEHHILHKYLGDSVVKIYKTDKPEKQSMWNTDSARYNYIARLFVGENKRIEWCTDKSGVKIKETIIEPILKRISGELSQYIKQKGANIATDNCNNINGILEKMKIAIMIIRDIDTGTIAESIIRYIAPHFSIDHKLLLKL